MAAPRESVNEGWELFSAPVLAGAAWSAAWLEEVSNMAVSRFALRGIELDPRSGWRRDAPARIGITSEDFWDRYDSTTLFYAAVLDEVAERLTIFGPPLFNLRALVEKMIFSTEDGSLAKPRLVRNGKFDCLEFRCRGLPATLRIEYDSFSATMDIDRRQVDTFKDRNLVYTLSKDNDPTWIKDWLIWNNRRHGADAVLIADNKSMSYSIDELSDIVSSVGGYKSAAIVSVPFSYGPNNRTAAKASYGEFLQVALLNVLWARWMSSARAVVIADIDELITSDDCSSIYDAAVSSFFGIVMCKGVWRYASTERAANSVTHADHVLANGMDKFCPPKYCLRPESFAGRRILKVHGVDNFKRVPFVSRDKFRFYHCRSISTSWKYDRDGNGPEGLSVDQATLLDLAKVFSD